MDPIPILPLPFEGAPIQRKIITKQDIEEFGATVACPGCNVSKGNQRAQAHSDRRRVRVEECVRIIPHGAVRLGRRNEVILAAFTEEVQRGTQKNKKE